MYTTHVKTNREDKDFLCNWIQQEVFHWKRQKRCHRIDEIRKISGREKKDGGGGWGGTEIVGCGPKPDNTKR